MLCNKNRAIKSNHFSFSENFLKSCLGLLYQSVHNIYCIKADFCEIDLSKNPNVKTYTFDLLCLIKHSLSEKSRHQRFMYLTFL